MMTTSTTASRTRLAAGLPRKTSITRNGRAEQQPSIPRSADSRAIVRPVPSITANRMLIHRTPVAAPDCLSPGGMVKLAVIEDGQGEQARRADDVVVRKSDPQVLGRDREATP